MIYDKFLITEFTEHEEKEAIDVPLYPRMTNYLESQT